MNTSLQFKRARVAISFPLADATDYSSLDTALHLGHARTLLLGSLIAKGLNTPFHVRLDGDRKKHVSDNSGLILDIVSCLNFLEIEYDLLYWHQQEASTPEVVNRELGKSAKRFDMTVHAHFVCPEYYQGLMCDDIITFYPSLVIRGTEFSNPRQIATNSAFTLSTTNHLQTEALLYDAADRIKHEVNVPLVTIDSRKMSKTIRNMAHWSLLRGMNTNDARNFLIATVLNPNDPLSCFSKMTGKVDTLSISDIIDEPYEWSWPIWADAIEISRRRP